MISDEGIYFSTINQFNMQKIFRNSVNFSWAIACLLIAIGCQKSIEKTPSGEQGEIAGVPKNPKALKDFQQVNLVGDNDEYDPARIDPNLVNGWGIAFAPSGPAWVSSFGTSLSVIYNKEGDDVRPPVTIPSPGSITGGHPTGIVFNGTTDFKLLNGNPARFIFGEIEGVISGWNTGNAAIIKVDKSPASVYTGLAMATDAGENFLYAANFSMAYLGI